MIHSPNLDIWTLKIENRHFYPLFNPCNQVQFQKNLMNRFREKLMLILIPKCPIYSVLGIRKIYLKKQAPFFICLFNPSFKQKMKKSNELILTKRCYRQTGGWADKAELIRSSGSVTGPIKTETTKENDCFIFVR